MIHNPFTLPSDTPTTSAASTSSTRFSSVTSISTDSVTDATRQAMLTSLESSNAAQPFFKTGHAHGNKSPTASAATKLMPSTPDLRRYVGAYIRYFHPHLPFLHTATLSFDAPAYIMPLQPSTEYPAFGQPVAGGGGSLLLIVAAIGALYEYDLAVSKQLFEMSKTMIQLYLQECQKVDMSATDGSAMDSQNTPLWLVQAMLLNVIYGYNCGEKTAANIANTHIAALVSLARSAELTVPATMPKQPDLSMVQKDSPDWDGYMTPMYNLDMDSDWHSWKFAEERKRTLYAIFILSSLIVSAYNCAPALNNSEIRLDLPCDEPLWSAESAEMWRALGGQAPAAHNNVPFASALSYLLTASQRKRQRQHSYPGLSTAPQDSGNASSDLKPSTFGCLILINAIHNYIWETRQRHTSRQWTAQETEAMHAHIEPALRAWQAAWSSNSNHSLERPNPFGASSLSADCIPLLDLAYVRLFVNLGSAKEAFFKRNWNAMANEIAQESDNAQHADPNAAVNSEHSSDSDTDSEHGGHFLSRRSKRETHLRKAAFCAANSLMMSDRLNVTFADFSSKELPLQSALCAFDCSQILAEWVSTVQDRVGRYIGLLGRDDIDLGRVPATACLDRDDIKLLQKTNEIIAHAEVKMSQNGLGVAQGTAAMGLSALDLEKSGYATGLLAVHARMLERQAIWPVCHEMAQALRHQVQRTRDRAEASLDPVE